MNRLRKVWQSVDEQAYEPLANSEHSEFEREAEDGSPTKTHHNASAKDVSDRFSYIEYTIFLLLGISMLWAWNMFLAAGPYFQNRFASSAWLRSNFQAAEISVSTVTNLTSMLILTRLQENASYPKRIVASLAINLAVFSLLAVSTGVEVGAGGYFGFLMVMMFLTSLAAGFCQNGLFAFVSGFGEARYTQGIMVGQAVAGVLPCVAQIISVVSVQQTKEEKHDGSNNNNHSDAPAAGEPPIVPWTAALAYFLTATAISVLTMLAFSFLLARSRSRTTHYQQPSTANLPSDLPDIPTTPTDSSPIVRKPIPLTLLFKKLLWPALSVFTTFALTMIFPIYTQLILSSARPPLLQPALFIPLALLFWNVGDLAGRLLTAVPSLSLVRRPRVVFALAAARLLWVGLYHLCNIGGRGAVVPSDFFYLVVVQFGFGISNGYIGSTCMIGAGEWVDEEEREAAGGFMGLCLVGGLTAGSLLSFVISGT